MELYSNLKKFLLLNFKYLRTIDFPVLNKGFQFVCFIVFIYFFGVKLQLNY